MSIEIRGRFGWRLIGSVSRCISRFRVAVGRRRGGEHAWERDDWVARATSTCLCRFRRCEQRDRWRHGDRIEPGGARTQAMPTLGLQSLQKENRHGRQTKGGDTPGKTALEKGRSLFVHTSAPNDEKYYISVPRFRPSGRLALKPFISDGYVFGLNLDVSFSRIFLFPRSFEWWTDRN